jgi:hypothetical protein
MAGKLMSFDVESALTALGMDFDVRGNEASALCPMHAERTGKEDANPSWWINLESGMHMCFSCHYKGNLVQLVCDVKEFYQRSWGTDKGYDYKAGEEWLASVAEMTVEQMLNIINSLPTYLEPLPKPVEMSEARLAIFVDPPQDALDSRNITAESASKYEVMWDATKKNWILPLREPHFNKLIGWQEKGTIDRTFMNRPPGLPKSKTLFGLEHQNESRVIVVESPLDCLRFDSAGIEGAVAICGSSISIEQVRLLRYSEQVIAAFDNANLDSAGAKACKEMLELSRKYALNLSFFNYGRSNKKDPGDMTDAELHWGVDNAVSSIFGELAYVSRDS